MKKINFLFTALWTIVFVILTAFLFYFGSNYQPKGTEKYLVSTSKVIVSENKDYYFFDSYANDKALIFYQGALVDERAYSPLMMALSEKGIDCFLVKMPYDFAVFGIDRADKIMNNYKYEKWYMAGHSLGGAMGEKYTAKHKGEFDGLFMLAAYGTENIKSDDLTVISIYASNDCILNKDKLIECRKNMPESYREIIIDGGNHAGFGMYGKQKGDGEASISSEEQIKAAAEAILSDVQAAEH